MEIIKAKTENLDNIISIYSKAREFMARVGNANQWQNGYPSKELIKQDIENGEFYICTDNDKIVAAFCFFVGDEPTYKNIYNGNWLNNKEYGVIHRIAVAEHQKGIASFCIQWCLKQYQNIKIDTHHDNTPMQKTILKNGFKYCGIIKKPDGSTRLAYQSV